MQCCWFYTADVAAFDGDLNPVPRGGQFVWRVCSVHVNNKHAKSQRDGRQTLADLVMLCLRDRVDCISGDFNQAYHYLGEVSL